MYPSANLVIILTHPLFINASYPGVINFTILVDQYIYILSFSDLCLWKEENIFSKKDKKFDT